MALRLNLHSLMGVGIIVVLSSSPFLLLRPWKLRASAGRRFAINVRPHHPPLSAGQPIPPGLSSASFGTNLAARRSVAKISRQSERADPGVRLTMLYRKAETGKRLMSGPQAIGIFITNPR